MSEPHGPLIPALMVSHTELGHTITKHDQLNKCSCGATFWPESISRVSIENLLTVTSAGDVVTVVVEGVIYQLHIISITRGEMVESFSDDVKRLQQLVREKHQAAAKHLDRLLKCRRQKRMFMMRVAELEK